MIWLIGNKGMLGTHLAGMLAQTGIPFDGTDVDLDITDKSQVMAFVSGKSFSHIINCAAYNAVDNAEDDAENAFRLNGTALKHLSEAANLTGACMIHFSTDYVFNGTKREGYTEDDPPSPETMYGASKLDGEKNVMGLCERYFVFRVSWLYGPHGKNFVHTMLNLFKERDRVSVVDDQFGSPTYTGELSRFVHGLAASDNRAYGLYHFSGEGDASWFAFADEIYRLSRKYNVIDRDVDVHPVDSSHYPAKAKRPAHSYLIKDKLFTVFGFRPKGWQETLEGYIKTIAT